MKTLEINEAFSAYAKSVRRGRPVVVTVKGKPAYAVIRVSQSEIEDFNLANNPEFIDIIERSRARLAAEGGISSQEMRRRLGIKSQRVK